MSRVQARNCLVAVLILISSGIAVPRGHSSTSFHPSLALTSLSPSALTTDPFNVSSSATNSRSPALAVLGNTFHVVWEEGARVYHRACRGGSWSTARSVATGEQPAIAVDSYGVAHVVFVNEFNENFEIYHCRLSGSTWSLPRNVSNTTGVSSSPDIAISPDGVLHVVWADNTPGYSVIYHAYWNGSYWLNGPIPHATGGAPTVAVSNDGVVHVVWQDRDGSTVPYEVYHSQLNSAGWSLPENLSDSVSRQSIIPRIVSDRQNELHVTWQEEADGHFSIYYTYGHVGFWSIPERVSQDHMDAYLPSPTIHPGGAVYVGWDVGTAAVYRWKNAHDNSWSPTSTVLEDQMGVADLRLTVDHTSQLHAVWAERVATDNWDVFYQRLSKQLHLPIIIKRI